MNRTPADIDITSTGGAIILLDWAAASDEPIPYSTQNVADLFFTELFGKGHNGHNLAELPIHLIGHSRGASLNSRLAYRLAEYGILVEQVTTLDPHPVGQWDYPVGNDLVPATYSNVIFSDNYFRTGAPPEGQNVAGTKYNDLSNTITGDSVVCTEHAQVHAYYHGTIPSLRPGSDGECTIYPSWYDQSTASELTGYNFSRYGRTWIARPVEGINDSIPYTEGRGSRVSVTSAFQFWPNVGFDQQRVGFPTRTTVGETVQIPYYYEDRGSPQTLTFVTDSDTNPFNGVRATIATVERYSSGGDIGSVTFPWTPTAADVGTHYIGAKTTNARTDQTRVRYDYYLKPVTVVAASTPTAPTIDSISPPSLTASSSQQTLTIHGSNFTAYSTLIFYYPDGSVSPERTPIYDNSGQLRYTSTFPTPGGWEVQVKNNFLDRSAAFPFNVASPSVTLTGLSIAGPATVGENGTASFSATALFSDGSTAAAPAATWSVSGSAASINPSTGLLTAGSVGADTTVTVSASYLTKTASANVTIVNSGSGGGTQTQELIANGNFESGPTAWRAITLSGGTNESADILQGSYPRPGGAWYAYVGDASTAVHDALGSLHQLIAIPANASSVVLSFYLNIVSSETTSSNAYDVMDVNLTTSSGTLFKKLSSSSNLDKGMNSAGNYRLVTIDMTADLAAYRGQSVRLQFYADTNSTNNTIFRIDDVSAIATVPSPATLTALVINGPSSLTEGSGAQYSATAVFSDGTTPSITATGWSVNPGYASISGSGYFNAGPVASDTVVTISASHTSGGVTRGATKDVTIVNLQQQPAAPVISSAGTASGAVNQSFSYQITAYNSPTSFGASELPPGLGFNASTGLISGTPTASGAFSVTVTATNAGGTDTKMVAITIAASATPGSRYTKIANSGAALPDSATLGSGSTNWACTRDNTTGLIWEVKTADGGLRDLNKTYTNYDDPTQPQKWNGSAYVNPTQTEIDAATNSIGFVKAVHMGGLCGYFDWWMPGVDEIWGIRDTSYTPAINPNFFPNTLASTYWAGVGDTEMAPIIGFGSIGSGGQGRNLFHHILLVHGGQTAPGSPTPGTITAGNASVSLGFTAPASDGGAAIDIYRASCYCETHAVCNSNSSSATGTSSPIVVTGLTNGAAYNCMIEAHNSVGWGLGPWAVITTVTPMLPVGSPGWQPASNLLAARQGHTATLLPDGKVLVAGGWNGGALASAERYDPASNAWSAAGSLASARNSHTATLLPNGQVLVAGGRGDSGFLASAELYDPASNTWSAAGSLSAARRSHSATLLPSGMVLVAGGQGSSGFLAGADLYDPASNTWSAAGSQTAARAGHSATLLPSGKVLVAGGVDSSGPLAGAELYDPASNAWSATGSLAVARLFHTATLLSDGKVLAVGGQDSGGSIASAERYDPASNAWSAAGTLLSATQLHSATLLPNGQVLVAGGQGSDYSSLADAELYDPASNIWRPTGSLTVARLFHTATLLPNGQVLVAGGQGNGGSLASTELYGAGNPGPATPGAPTIGIASAAGIGSLFVAFTAPASNGGAAIDNYRATCGGIAAVSGSGSSTSINVTGLVNGTPTTCTVAAHNPVGWSGESAVSNSVTPVAPIASMNGVCGSANGAASAFAPSSGLCVGSAASAVTGGASWTWSCRGSGGGSDIACSASNAPTPAGGSGQAIVSGGAWVVNQAQSAGFVPVTGNSKSPPVPPPVSLPYGLLDVTLNAGAPGSSATITITYPAPLPPGTLYWKYGRTAGNPTAHWYVFPSALIVGNTVTLTLTDGALGDDDLTANGVIVDPGGPGLPDAAGIPTLSEWGVILLSGLMALFGWVQLRRRYA